MRTGGSRSFWPSSAPLQSARRPNEVWVIDFVADVLESGRRFRVFNVEDQFTRTGLATEVDTSLPSARIVRVLDRLLSEHDKPLLIVSDNGTELTSNAMLKWTAINGIEWRYIAPGKATVGAATHEPSGGPSEHRALP
jgi:putative transposase